MKTKVLSFLFISLLCAVTAVKAQNCVYCKGTGKMIKEVSISTYGYDTKVWCSICERYYWRSTGHMHVTCQYCRGTGRRGGNSYSSSSSSSQSSRSNDDFLAANLTFEEMEQLRFWNKCLYTGYPYEGPCQSCGGSRVCNWCKGSGYIKAGFGGRYVTVMCNNCYNGACKTCAGLGKTTQYSKRPEHMQIIRNKIAEIYEIAKRRTNSY